MNILGLDLSLTSTGVCLPDGDTTTVKPRTDGMARLHEVRAAVMPWVETADVVVIEGYAFGTHGRAHALGELGGAIRLALWDAGVPYVDIAPKTLKRYACGNGNASKHDVAQSAAHRTGRMFGTTDEADAWWLWALAMDAAGEPVVSMPQAHRKVLETVHLPERTVRA